MSKKLNNKILLGVFLGLVVVFAFVKWYRSPKTESSFKSEIAVFDTAEVTKIALYPSSYKGEEILFSKDKKAWKLSSGKIKTTPDPQAVNNLMSLIKEIKPQRLITKDKKKWADFQLTDSATRVKVFTGSKEALDLLIGKFTYQQSKDPYAQMRGGGVTGTSYIRLHGEDEVYAVEGFLTFSFNQPFNTYRNQAIARLDQANITKLNIKLPGDTGFIAEKKNGKWMIGNNPADSAKVESYLNMLSFKSASSFNDFFKPAGLPGYQIFVETSNNKNLTIDAYPNGENQWVINSSYNPESWFTAGKNDLFGELFKGKQSFLASENKKK